MDDRFSMANDNQPDTEHSVRQIERLLADHDVEGSGSPSS